MIPLGMILFLAVPQSSPVPGLLELLRSENHAERSQSAYQIGLICTETDNHSDLGSGKLVRHLEKALRKEASGDLSSDSIGVLRQLAWALGTCARHEQRIPPQLLLFSRNEAAARLRPELRQGIAVALVHLLEQQGSDPVDQIVAALGNDPSEAHEVPAIFSAALDLLLAKRDGPAVSTSVGELVKAENYRGKNRSRLLQAVKQELAHNLLRHVREVRPLDSEDGNDSAVTTSIETGQFSSTIMSLLKEGAADGEDSQQRLTQVLLRELTEHLQSEPEVAREAAAQLLLTLVEMSNRFSAPENDSQLSEGSNGPAGQARGSNDDRARESALLALLHYARVRQLPDLLARTQKAVFSDQKAGQIVTAATREAITDGDMEWVGELLRRESEKTKVAVVEGILSASDSRKEEVLALIEANYAHLEKVPRMQRLKFLGLLVEEIRAESQISKDRVMEVLAQIHSSWASDTPDFFYGVDAYLLDAFTSALANPREVPLIQSGFQHLGSELSERIRRTERLPPSKLWLLIDSLIQAWATLKTEPGATETVHKCGQWLYSLTDREWGAVASLSAVDERQNWDLPQWEAWWSEMKYRFP